MGQGPATAIFRLTSSLSSVEEEQVTLVVGCSDSRIFQLYYKKMFCILQAIKNWSWGRPGNEAISEDLELSVGACSYAPINIMPHYPPYGQKAGNIGALTKGGCPYSWAFDYL